MHEHDDIRLRHMLEAAREAVSFTHDRVRDDLETDRQTKGARTDRAHRTWSGGTLELPVNTPARLISAYFRLIPGLMVRLHGVDWATDESRS
jgi:hypothetical protein